MSGMQVYESPNHSSRPGLLTHCLVKKLKVSQSKKATKLNLNCTEINPGFMPEVNVLVKIGRGT